MLQAQLAEFGGVAANAIRTSGASEFRARRNQIHAQDAAASGFQHLHGQLSEQAKTDDRNHITQLHLRSTDSMQGDRSNRGESSLIKTLSGTEGIFATSSRGTHAISACTAYPAPAQATRSPTLEVGDALPNSDDRFPRCCNPGPLAGRDGYGPSKQRTEDHHGELY